MIIRISFERSGEKESRCPVAQSLSLNPSILSLSDPSILFFLILRAVDWKKHRQMKIAEMHFPQSTSIFLEKMLGREGKEKEP